MRSGKTETLEPLSKEQRIPQDNLVGNILKVVELTGLTVDVYQTICYQFGTAVSHCAGRVKGIYQPVEEEVVYRILF